MGVLVKYIDKSMIVVKGLIHNKFTKVETAVFTDRSLSDGAKVLYAYLSGINTNKQYSDSYFIKALGISSDTLARRKRELKRVGLIMVGQISSRVYTLFIGTTNYPAIKVKTDWERNREEIL